MTLAIVKIKVKVLCRRRAGVSVEWRAWSSTLSSVEKLTQINLQRWMACRRVIMLYIWYFIAIMRPPQHEQAPKVDSQRSLFFTSRRAKTAQFYN